MKSKFTKLDKEYQKELIDWIPEKIIDFHTHIGLSKFVGKITISRKKSTFVSSNHQSYENLKQDMEFLLPGKEITFVSFPFPFREVDIQKSNEYTIEKAEYPFILGDIFNPESTLKLLNEKSAKGLKVYYDFVKKDYSKIYIHDFLPDVFLKKLNSLKKVLMLHVPQESLNNEKNIEDIFEICSKYKNIKVVLAHMGRCHDKEDFSKGIEKLKNLSNLFFDTSTVTSKEVFSEALQTLGSKRILYGSDSPFCNPKGDIINVEGIMRAAFITKDVFDWTLPELREWYLKNKPNLTFLLFHQLDGMKKATEDLKLTKLEIEDIFYNNAKELL
jgi:Tat protein secretion system quality control protein TatD with DNase activity